MKSIVISILVVAFSLSLSRAGEELTPDEKTAFQVVYQLQDEGRWEEAFQSGNHLVDIVKGNHGESSKFTLAALNEVAIAGQETGRYSAAILAIDRAVNIAIKMGKANSLTASKLLTNLSGVYQTIGEFEAARDAVERSIMILETIEPVPSPSLAHAKNNLGTISWALGDFAAAESSFSESVDWVRQNADEEKSLARFLTNLGGVKIHGGKDGSEELQHAFEVRKRLLGFEHPKTLETLIFIGEVFLQMGRIEDALRQFTHCLERRRQVFAANHVETAEAETRVGEVLLLLGKNREASEILDLAVAHYRESVGEHIDLHRPLFAAGKAALNRGEQANAARIAGELEALEEELLRRILQFTNQRERVAFLDLAKSYHLYARLKDPDGLVRVMLNTRGLVLDSLLRENKLLRAAHSGKMERLAELRDSRARARKLFLQIDSKAGVKEVNQALEEVSRLEREILEVEEPRFFSASQPDANDLKAATGGDQFFTLFVEYDSSAGESLAAVTISDGDCRFVDLGLVNDIERDVEAFLNFAERPDLQADAEVLKLTTALFRKVVEPVMVPGKSKWSIVSGETLAFLPFGCLTDGSGRFLIENLDLCYLSHPREQLVTPARAQKGGSALVVGNPAYGAKNPGPASPGPFMKRFFGEAELAAIGEGMTNLPGAEREARLLAEKFRASRIDTDLLWGNSAREEALGPACRGKRILHFATHGLYLGRRETGPDDHFHPGPAAFHNPMFQGWLALAGIQSGVNHWAAGKALPSGSDGILMAGEVAGLDLTDCDLVTLSACQSGRGKAHRSGGIMGLRRGFGMAGARHLLTTLWSIDDDATVALMSDFYDDYLQTGDAIGSLNAAKRKHLLAHRKTGGIHSAIFLSGPFVLSR